MKAKLFQLVTAAGIAVTVLTGCSGQPVTPSAHTVEVSATVTATATQCGSCDGSPQADHTGISDPGWDDQAKTDALDVASQAMILYNRRTVDSKTWIHDLAQYMTNEAGAKYQGVDPANIPVFKTIGAPKLLIDEGNGFAAHVEFPTTIGVFDFDLNRQGANREWKIKYINMPDGFH